MAAAKFLYVGQSADPLPDAEDHYKNKEEKQHPYRSTSHEIEQQQKKLPRASLFFSLLKS